MDGWFAQFALMRASVVGCELRWGTRPPPSRVTSAVLLTTTLLI